MRKALYVTAAALVAVLGWSGAARTAPAAAATGHASDWCREGGLDTGRDARFCEVRELTLGTRGRIEVEAAPNGSVQVEGGPRGDVRVQARVEARAGSEAEARALAAQVQVSTAGKLHATGPEGARDRHWAVSYRLWVPEHSALTLRALNGGLHVQGVTGEIDARTVNGGVHLSGVGGRVLARTTNGGLHVELADTWQGPGLDAETTNGGVHVTLPAGLDAHLEVSTVTGGIHSDLSDLPVSGGQKAGRHTIGGSISADLGRGGPTLRLVTTNGGVHVGRR